MFSAGKNSMSKGHQRQTVTSSGIFNQTASQSNYTITKKGISTCGSTMITASQKNSTANGQIILDGSSLNRLDDLECLCSNSNPKEVEQAKDKYAGLLNDSLKLLQTAEQSMKTSNVLDSINDAIKKAWAVPTWGHELGYTLCNTLRNSGGLDLLMKNCVEEDDAIQFSSARLLEQCLTTENRSHVVDHGLEKVVNVACVCTKNTKTGQYYYKLT